MPTPEICQLVIEGKRLPVSADVFAKAQMLLNQFRMLEATHLLRQHTGAGMDEITEAIVNRRNFTLPEAMDADADAGAASQTSQPAKRTKRQRSAAKSVQSAAASGLRGLRDRLSLVEFELKQRPGLVAVALLILSLSGASLVFGVGTNPPAKFQPSYILDAGTGMLQPGEIDGALWRANHGIQAYLLQSRQDEPYLGYLLRRNADTGKAEVAACVMSKSTLMWYDTESAFGRGVIWSALTRFDEKPATVVQVLPVQVGR